MGLGQYVYPRFAAPIDDTGLTIPIDKLRARCLWYPGDGLMVSGHVLYVSQALHESMMEVALSVEDSDAEVEVEGGEEGISHRLATPVPTSKYASVPQLIRAVFDRTRQALPVTKRGLLSNLSPDAPPDKLLPQLEAVLHKEGLHVLVPLSVGRRYQLFTDATEELVRVAPYSLGRAPRLCFVLLSTDSLVDKRDGSPWLRQATQLMVLPVNAMRVHPSVLGFIDDLTALRPVRSDPHLLWELATAMHEVTGGWPDLCDRFHERVRKLKDVQDLRDWLCDLSSHIRAAELSPAEHGDELVRVALGDGPPLKDLPPPGSGADGGAGLAHDALIGLARAPTLFTWAEHGQAYLDGILGRDRGLAVPRSRIVELAVRGRLAQPRQPSGSYAVSAEPSGALRVPREPSGIFRAPTAGVEITPARPPEERRASRLSVRWLHVSDLHFGARDNSDAEIVLEALLQTVKDLYQGGEDGGYQRRADLIFVTGDIAYTGSEAEYARARKYLLELCAAARVAPAQVHMVPGNHDVFRPKGEGLARTLNDAESAQRYFQKGATRYHLEKLGAFRAFYDSFYAEGAAGEPARQAADGHATALSGVVTVPGSDLTIGILPLNTAWFAQGDDDSGKLLVGEQVVRAGLAAIADAQLRIALMHHPISDLSQLERKLVQDRLSEGCHLILRGHLHDTEANWYSTAYKQSLELAAGAAYQGRAVYQNRALFVEVELFPEREELEVRPYPIRYELTGHDRFTLDTSVFPKSYPTYLESLKLPLGRKGKP